MNPTPPKPAAASRDGTLLLWAKGLRAFADGFASILLPVYLLQLGFDVLQVGILATVTLLGSACLTLLVGMYAHRFDRRHLLMAASVMMAITGISFCLADWFWVLLLIGFFGTFNPSGGDVSVFLPLEQAVLAETATDEDRTKVFARYSLVGSLVGAVGSLAAAAPDHLGAIFSLTPARAIQAMLIAYALIAVAALLVYDRLSIQVRTGSAGARPALGKSKGIVYKLAALFSVDSFAGGLFVQSLLALWLLDRFDLSLTTAASIFFWTGLLAAFSYLLAVRIAKRIGLINTMVFTHLPANVCMIIIPFVPDLTVVIILLLVRGLLSQMDVPTRTSYVMAVVEPAERPAAASITAVPRSLAAAASPMVTGYLMTVSSFGWPLIIGGAIKIVYDLALLAMFRHTKPPEERNTAK